MARIDPAPTFALAGYPRFKPITLGDKPLFDAALAQHYPETSELTFTGFYAWRAIERNEFTILGDLIVVKQGVAEPEQFYEPIGGGDKKDAIDRILRESRGAFICISKATAQLLDGDEDFVVTPQRDHFDYVYRAQDLIALAGAKYDGKRNFIRRFKADNIYEYVTFDAGSVGQCLEFEEAWCDIKDCDNVEGLGAEREALRAMADDFSALGLIAAGIKIKDKLCAIAIAGRLNPETLLVHVFKAYPDIVGLYPAMLNEFLSRQASSFKYVNMEDDLGVDGLRKSKLSYDPLRLVEKYRIALR